MNNFNNLIILQEYDRKKLNNKYPNIDNFIKKFPDIDFKLLQKQNINFKTDDGRCHYLYDNYIYSYSFYNGEWYKKEMANLYKGWFN